MDTDTWEISCFTQLNGEIETECVKEKIEDQLPNKGGEENGN